VEVPEDMTLGSTWAAVTIDCQDSHLVAEFWAELLETTARDVGRSNWYRIGPLVENGPVITFQPVPEPKTGKTRVHVDVRVEDLDAATLTVERLGGSGPAHIYNYDEGIVAVMADPEGNEFCLVALVAGAALA
jgi:predicted enzyme related to lactoylglutathione lyase